MNIVCLDLEGVLVPEIWIAFAEKTGIPEFRRTTRDEPDYDKLMHYRIDLLDKHGLKLPQIQEVISSMRPLIGAEEFLDQLRERTQVLILSDTFDQFSRPLMKKLNWPAIFCNSLDVSADGRITGYKLTAASRATSCAARSRSLRPSRRCRAAALTRSPPATATTTSA